MRKFLNILLTLVIAMLAVFSLTACSPDDDGVKSNAKGLLINKVKGVYIIYDYVPETELTDGVLDIGKILTDEGYSGEFKIKKGAFSGNTDIVKLIVPDTVKEIAKGAFEKMKNLKELEVPYIGKTINSDAYYRESADAVDKSVNAEKTLAHFFGAEEYAEGKQITVAGTTCYMPVTLDTITVNATKYYQDPNQVKEEYYSIPKDALSGATNIKKVNLKGTYLGAIGENAFSGCTALTTITIPATVEIIYKDAFKGCTKLESVIIDSQTANKSLVIKEGVFSGCAKMNFIGTGTVTNLTLDVSKIASVGKNAFNFGRENVEYNVAGGTIDNLANALGDTKIVNA